MKVAGPVAAVMTADWAEHRFKLVQVRTAVFVDEQGVPPEIEMDSEDAGCHHLLALLGEEAVGTARLLADGRIGRLAVLKPIGVVVSVCAYCALAWRWPSRSG